jgi:hypothetical protein
VTTNGRTAPLTEPRHVAFRLTILVFALALGAQCVWLLLSEFSRPGINALPSDATAAMAAAKQRDAAFWAASVGVVRGDLWAESAFTYADLLFDLTPSSTNPAVAESAAHARFSVDHALKNGPHQSSVWLLLSGLALRFPSEHVDPLEALKMSYYTGPSEQKLFSLRLWLATRADHFDDVAMREFANREVRLLLKANQNSAIAEAYNIASPAGKLFIEGTVADLDPAFVKSLRASSTQKPSFRN